MAAHAVVAACVDVVVVGYMRNVEGVGVADGGTVGGDGLPGGVVMQAVVVAARCADAFHVSQSIGSELQSGLVQGTQSALRTNYTPAWGQVSADTVAVRRRLAPKCKDCLFEAHSAVRRLRAGGSGSGVGGGGSSSAAGASSSAPQQQEDEQEEEDEIVDVTDAKMAEKRARQVPRYPPR